MDERGAAECGAGAALNLEAVASVPPSGGWPPAFPPGSPLAAFAVAAVASMLCECERGAVAAGHDDSGVPGWLGCLVGVLEAEVAGDAWALEGRAGERGEPAGRPVDTAARPEPEPGATAAATAAKEWAGELGTAPATAGPGDDESGPPPLEEPAECDGLVRPGAGLAAVSSREPLFLWVRDSRYAQGGAADVCAGEEQQLCVGEGQQVMGSGCVRR